jgi:outer membrane protein
MVLIPALPEFRDAQRQLTEQNTTDQATLQEMYASFQGGMAEYEAQKNLLTAEQRTKKETDLVAKQSAIEQKAGELDAKLSERQSALIGPIYEKVDEAIQQVAKGRGLDLVLRIQMAPNEPSILYANEDRVVDITREVADLLGLPKSEAGE